MAEFLLPKWDWREPSQVWEVPGEAGSLKRFETHRKALLKDGAEKAERRARTLQEAALAGVENHQ